jgi:hypothetical protein
MGVVIEPPHRQQDAHALEQLERGPVLHVSICLRAGSPHRRSGRRCGRPIEGEPRLLEDHCDLAAGRGSERVLVVTRRRHRSRGCGGRCLAARGGLESL